MSFLLRDESFDCRFINMGIVLVNCVPGFFQSSSGLQQGGPFSLYLFVIAMKALCCLLKRVKEGGYLLGSKVIGRRCTFCCL